MDISNKLSTKTKYAKLVSLLFNARTNTHIAHLQTTSYAQHKALNEFYDGVIDLADRFAESAQGSIGIITGYTIGDLFTGSITDYLKGQLTEILSMRSQFQEGHLVQIIDDVVELYTSTLYKLTILK